jgi:hypothetical protein
MHSSDLRHNKSKLSLPPSPPIQNASKARLPNLFPHLGRLGRRNSGHIPIRVDFRIAI